LRPSHLGSSPSNPLSFELIVHRATSTDEDNVLCCADCRVPLDLHQPDLAEPMQLLATCGCCSRWFMLVDFDLDSDETLLLELPSTESIRLAHAASPLD
jgi:hypothetical protein